MALVYRLFCHFLPNQLVELVLNVENCVAGKKACASDFVVLLATMELKLTATIFVYSIDDLYLRLDRKSDNDTLKYANKRCCSARIRERERFHIT